MYFNGNSMPQHIDLPYVLHTLLRSVYSPLQVRRGADVRVLSQRNQHNTGVCLLVINRAHGLGGCAQNESDHKRVRPRIEDDLQYVKRYLHTR